MHFPKSLTESQNFSEIIPTEVCVPPLLLAAVFESPPEFPSFSLAANPSPGPRGVVTILRTLCCCCQSGGDSWLSTCSQKCSTWHLGGRKLEELTKSSWWWWYYIQLCGYWWELTQWVLREFRDFGDRKVKKALEKGKCFCYLCQYGRANFGFITPPPVTFHWASLSRELVFWCWCWHFVVLNLSAFGRAYFPSSGRLTLW